MDTGLQDKAVLVTGGAGGIGEAVCRAFAAEGARVAVHFHSSAGPAEALASDIGGVAVGADLRVEEDADGLVPAVVSLLGSLDVCVANAGAYPPDDVPLWDLPLHRWEETLRSNLTATFLTVRPKHNKPPNTQTRSLVMVGSTAGTFGGAISSGLLLTLKNEAARIGDGVRVNAVAPGWVATPKRVRAGIDPGLVERAISAMSLKKLATPEDVAAQIVALASDQVSGHLSGQVITVAGGMEGRQIP